MRELLKPKAVGPGTRWSAIAPASPAQEERVDDGMKALRALGFEPVLGAHASASGPLYFAGSPEERLADLHAAFADAESDAIIALRGGYGSNYLLGGIALDVIAAHPKPLFGYSDLTGVQLHLLDKLGLPAFYGPMLAADFSRPEGVHLESFRAALAGELYSVGAAEGLRLLQPGKSGAGARGVLYGGCLSILVSLLGTPWEPKTEGTLLFVEDVGAKPYQIDRMLWQLRKAGKLNGVGGVIFGEMPDCFSPGAPAELLEEAIGSALDGFDGPVAMGLRSGHVSRENVTLTFGVEAELQVGNETRLAILEAAVGK